MCDFAAGAKRNWIGWFAMTLLVSLGAPFWYDFLKSMMGIKDKLKSATAKEERKKSPKSGVMPRSKAQPDDEDIPAFG